MPRRKDERLHSNWKVTKDDPDKSKVLILSVTADYLKREYECIHCKKGYTGNVTHLKEHLEKCRTYQKTLKANKNPPINSLQQTQLGKPAQVEINFPRLTPVEKAEMDIKAAMWCFMDNFPFTMYESTWAKDFLHRATPAYKPPSRAAISGPLLDTIHSQVKSRTEQVIQTLPHINVITDESTNINTARICNISIHTAHGSLHYVSEDIRAMQTTAAISAQWLRNHLHQITNHDPDRINSVTNDTCSTMFSMWNEVAKFDEFRHVFFIPCDSHGIQLFFKDLLKLPRFNDIIQQAQTVVTAFRKASLQYARLRICQQACYKRNISLVLSVITRWGTQYRLISSLLNSKDALKRYVCDYEDLPPDKRIKQSVIDIIMSEIMD